MPEKICDRCGGTGKLLDSAAVGKRLAGKIEKAGISQARVARELKISPSQLCLLLEGKRQWSEVLMRKCERVLAV